MIFASENNAFGAWVEVVQPVGGNAPRHFSYFGTNLNVSTRKRAVFGAGTAELPGFWGGAYIFGSALVPPVKVKSESVRGLLAMKNVHLR